MAAVLERFRRGDRFLSIAADSGAGKSSFVRAGYDEWRIATLQPGDQPLDALALSPGSRQLLFLHQFEELFTPAAGPTPFRNVVLRIAQRPHSRLQVVVAFRIDFFALCRCDERIWELLCHHYLLPASPASGCSR